MDALRSSAASGGALENGHMLELNIGRLCPFSLLVARHQAAESMSKIRLIESWDVYETIGS